MMICWVTLLAAPALTRRMGQTGMNVMTRLMGLLVMVIGAQFVINGATTVVLDIVDQHPRRRDRAERNPDAIGEPWRQVLPVQPADVLAHLQRVVHFSFVAGQGLAARSRQQLGVTPGSNAWAVAPSRSASGNALLLMNPHLPWGEHFTFYEVHLNGPDLNAYGAALVGLPMLAMGFNEHLGWAHTVNTIDAADLFDLETRGDAYLFDDELRPFGTVERTLRVRQADGTIAERPLVVHSSVHGPVIARRDGRAIALRVAGLDAPHVLQQYWDMVHATNRASFEAALGRLQMPLFTAIYADRTGDILHVFNGRVPVRERGDWAYWQGTAAGGTSTTLWTDVHQYWELPRVLNPASGWLQNANDPPWTTTLPPALEPDRFPPYIAPRTAPSFRAQRSLRMLAEDERITFDELVAYKHSSRMEAADHLVQDVVAAARAAGDEDARTAADVLERWDRHADADSRGAVLFAQLHRQLQRTQWPGGSMFEVPWTPRAPLATPDGLADPARTAAALGHAARTVRALHGDLDVPWGDVYRLRRDTLDLPASGGPGELGIFRVIDFAPLAGDSTRFVATGGDGFVAAVEFSSPIRARALLGYGNASQPGSPHRTDQLPLMARGELRTVLFTRDDVVAAGVRLAEYF
jgi:acyl-homoserine-lactone acylase